MTNAQSLFRSLIIYGCCLPLAIILGYLLSDPLNLFTVVTIGLLFALFMVPLLLKWHYPWLLLAWNSTMGLYFLPGKPTMVMALIAVSFTIAVLSYIMNRNLKFLSVPSVTWPLLFITAVVFGTAELNGGMGLNALGAQEIGGKRYLILFLAVIGYFTLTARQIPPEKRRLYINLFYIGGLSGMIGSLAAVITPSFYFIFLIFQADSSLVEANPDGIKRLGGIALASFAVVSWMLARHGMAGIFNPHKRMRTVLFFGMVGCVMLGGYRSTMISVMLVCGILFYQEGLFRSRLLPVMILGMILLGAMTVGFANKLPLSMQRSLSFLPLNLNPEAVENARGSSEWRVIMWEHVLPQVPRYLLLGKGMSIDASELDMASRGMNAGEDASVGAAIAGDYHSGPLSLIIPFGLFGVAGFFWFLIASIRALYSNYKFGDPDLVVINRFLLASFIVKTIMYFFIFGSFYSDLIVFTGMIGFSVALNGGVRRSPAVVRSEPRPMVRNRLNLVGAATR